MKITIERYDMYERKYRDHKHRAGPFTIVKEDHSAWICEDSSGEPFKFDHSLWALKHVACTRKVDERDLTVTVTRDDTGDVVWACKMKEEKARR